jgi:hypothetical protein
MNAWLESWFNARQARLSGGVTRRARVDVERYGGSLANVRLEARKRGWHLIESGDQIIMLCNDGELTIHC